MKFNSFIQTVSGTLLNPKTFFSQMTPAEDYKDAFWFGLICSTIGATGAMLWSLTKTLPSSYSEALLAIVVIIALSAILTIFSMAVGTLVLHVCLWLVGGVKEELGATFKVICYTTSADLWCLIPLFGWLISLVWGIYIVVVGLREVHHTTTRKALFAVFLPLIVLLILLIIGAAIIYYLIGAPTSWNI